MARHYRPILACVLATIGLSLGPNLAAAPEGGHGGGPGHFPAGPGFRGGFGPGFRGYYGYRGWYGYGFGAGLGYDLWGYPYYGYGYPVYGDGPPGPPPYAYPPPGPVGAMPPPEGSPAWAPARLTDSDVLLSVHVPADAVVRINGSSTTQTGPRREFISTNLSPGRSYTFVVTAQWKGPNGQAVELQRTISVQGGERRHVDFTMSPPAPNYLPPVDRAGR